MTFYNAKYVDSNDTGWREEGHDACRAESTSASTNMEWCIRDRSQVEVIRISKVKATGMNCDTCGRWCTDLNALTQHREPRR